MTIYSRLSARSALRKVIERLGRETELLQRSDKQSVDEIIEDLEEIDGLLHQQEIFLKGKH